MVPRHFDTACNQPAAPAAIADILAVADAVAEARRRLEDSEDLPIAKLMGSLLERVAAITAVAPPALPGLQEAFLALIDELEQLSAIAGEERQRIARVLGNLAGAKRASSAYLAPGRRP